MEEIVYPSNIKPQFLKLVQNHLEKIEAAFSVEIAMRGNKIMFNGESNNSKHFKKYMKHMIQLSQENSLMTEHDLEMSLSMIHADQIDALKDELKDKLQITINGKTVVPKTFNQKSL